MTSLNDTDFGILYWPFRKYRGRRLGLSSHRRSRRNRGGQDRSHTKARPARIRRYRPTFHSIHLCKQRATTLDRKVGRITLQTSDLNGFVEESLLNACALRKAPRPDRLAHNFAPIGFASKITRAEPCRFPVAIFLIKRRHINARRTSLNARCVISEQTPIRLHASPRPS